MSFTLPCVLCSSPQSLHLLAPFTHSFGSNLARFTLLLGITTVFRKNNTIPFYCIVMYSCFTQLISNLIASIFTKSQILWRYIHGHLSARRQTESQFTLARTYHYFAFLTLHILVFFPGHDGPLFPHAHQRPRPHHEFDNHCNDRSPCESKHNTTERNMIDRSSINALGCNTSAFNCVVFNLIPQVNHLSGKDC